MRSEMHLLQKSLEFLKAILQPFDISRVLV